MRQSLVLIFCLALNGVSFGQYDFIAVLPDLDGQDLMEQLEINYKPSQVLSYDIARDTLFKRVYGINDSLACVYTGHRLHMPPGTDPTQAVFLNGAANGINTEHTWPQSFGAGSGNPRGNMHHLYPTRVQVNSDRASLPFLDIPDNQAAEWYYLTNEQTNVPGSNIDLYSERSGSAFEPREDHKGNVARAIMYFRTIYADAAQQAPSDFFTSMQQTLCQWHSDDPVDALEWNRNMIIATYQSGKVNPFILDCTLPQRLFCQQQTANCDMTVSNTSAPSIIDFSIFPNPNHGAFTIAIPAIIESGATVTIYDALGRVMEKRLLPQTRGEVNFSISTAAGKGIFFVELRTSSGVGVERIVIQE